MRSRDSADTPNFGVHALASATVPSTPARSSPLQIRRDSIASNPGGSYCSPQLKSGIQGSSSFNAPVTPLAAGSTKITTQLARSHISRSSTSPAALAKKTATPTSRARATSSLPAVPARTPLAPRDRNVLAVPRRQRSNLSLSACSSEATPTKMAPIANASSTSVRQPQMPVLSPAAARALNRGVAQPLTPKIATGMQQQPYTTATVASPIARRVQGKSEPTPSNSSGASAGSQREGFASPNSAFVGIDNVTPRSGKRQSRVDSANSTPNGTPYPERTDAWETRSGLGIVGSVADSSGTRPRAVTSSVREADKPDPDAKFFYAAEARPTPSTSTPAARPPSAVAPKNPSFFYASETAPQTAGPPVASPLSYLPGGGGSQDSFSNKFVYANGSPEVPAAGSFPSSRPGSVISTAPRLAANRSAPPAQPSTLQRPASPIKTLTQTSTKSAVVNAIPQSAPPPPKIITAARRRVSLETGPRRGGSHSRAGSVVMADDGAAARLPQQNAVRSLSPSSNGPSPASPSFPFPASTAPAAAGLSGILQMTEGLVLATPLSEEPGPVDSQDGPQSPTKSQADSHLNDLISTARRERKVQDLEITTASLEAINRTLERQLRKQTVELRRFRRMSRHGRLSLASSLPADVDDTAPGGRIVSGSSAGGGALARAGMSLEDLSEDDEDDPDAEHDGSDEDDEDDEDDDTESDSASGSGTGTSSPRGAALRSERRRRRDGRRLQLDLSKHQQLLVDSQKMNQSIKRCLGWTEELIKEGRKALNFTVRVSEVEFGGRVLHPDEHEIAHEGADDGEEQLGGYVFEGGGAVENVDDHAISDGKQDRDSAVELLGGAGD